MDRVPRDDPDPGVWDVLLDEGEDLPLGLPDVDLRGPALVGQAALLVVLDGPLVHAVQDLVGPVDSNVRALDLPTKKGCMCHGSANDRRGDNNHASLGQVAICDDTCDLNDVVLLDIEASHLQVNPYQRRILPSASLSVSIRAVRPRSFNKLIYVSTIKGVLTSLVFDLDAGATSAVPFGVSSFDASSTTGSSASPSNALNMLPSTVFEGPFFGGISHRSLLYERKRPTDTQITSDINYYGREPFQTAGGGISAAAALLASSCSACQWSARKSPSAPDQSQRVAVASPLTLPAL